MNATNLDSHTTPDPTAGAPDAAIIGGALKGLVLGLVVIWPALMAMFALAFEAGGAELAAVSIGALMMAELLGGLIGMGMAER